MSGVFCSTFLMKHLLQEENGQRPISSLQVALKVLCLKLLASVDKARMEGNWFSKV
jgi:hypothetical protein